LVFLMFLWGGKKSTSVFHKKTHTDHYLNFSSHHHHLSVFTGVVTCLRRRSAMYVTLIARSQMLHCLISKQTDTHHCALSHYYKRTVNISATEGKHKPPETISFLAICRSSIWENRLSL
jgi:hypothetical protein